MVADADSLAGKPEVAWGVRHENANPRHGIGTACCCCLAAGTETT